MTANNQHFSPSHLKVIKKFVEEATLTTDGERVPFNKTAKLPTGFVIKMEGSGFGPLFQYFGKPGDIFSKSAPAFVHKRGELSGTPVWVNTSLARRMAKAAGLTLEVF